MTSINKVKTMKLLNDVYYNQLYGMKNLVADYLTSIDEEITIDNCIIKDNFLSKKRNIPLIMLEDGTKIRFMSNSRALMQMLVCREEENKKTYSFIYYPANPRKVLYNEEGLKIRPYMSSITITNDGIYKSIYKPYKKYEKKADYYGETPLVTKYYNNETIKNNNINKDDIKSLRKQLSKVKADKTFTTEIPYLDEFDISGVKTLDYNMIQAVLTAESLTNTLNKIKI